MRITRNLSIVKNLKLPRKKKHFIFVTSFLPPLLTKQRNFFPVDGIDIYWHHPVTQKRTRNAGKKGAKAKKKKEKKLQEKGNLFILSQSIHITYYYGASSKFKGSQNFAGVLSIGRELCLHKTFLSVDCPWTIPCPCIALASDRGWFAPPALIPSLFQAFPHFQMAWLLHPYFPIETLFWPTLFGVGISEGKLRICECMKENRPWKRETGLKIGRWQLSLSLLSPVLTS